MKNIFVISVLSLSTLSTVYAAANPEHIELFNARNFCVLCTFNEALLSPETLYGRAHSNANISGTYVYDTVMDNLDLTFAFLYAIKGERFTIKNSDVRMINLTYSDLPYFTFTGNNGELVNFTGSGLTNGNFCKAKLENPIFTSTGLEGTDFTQTQFTQAFFDKAWLRNTNFTNAQLLGADFTDAVIENVNFTGANLYQAKITAEQLEAAIVCNTVLPDGSRSDC